MAEICFQKAPPGQDLAQMGRFPMVPEGDFNCRPKGRQKAEICFQKAPGQDLAQNGRFPMIREEKFNSRPRGRQMAEICFQKAPGLDLAQKGRFPMVPEGDFNCRPKGRQKAEICFQKVPGQDLALLGTPGWGQEVEANVLGFRVSPFVRDTSVRVTAAAIELGGSAP